MISPPDDRKAKSNGIKVLRIQKHTSRGFGKMKSIPESESKNSRPDKPRARCADKEATSARKVAAPTRKVIVSKNISALVPSAYCFFATAIPSDSPIAPAAQDKTENATPNNKRQNQLTSPPPKPSPLHSPHSHHPLRFLLLLLRGPGMR